MKEAVDNKLDADPLEVAQLYSQTMQRYNTFDTADIARFVKNTANTNSVDDIAGMLFNGNTEAAQKFVEKYSNIEIPEVDTELADSTNIELPSVILGTAKSYDEIQNVDQTVISGYNNTENYQSNGGVVNAQINQGGSEKIGNRGNQDISGTTRASKESWTEDKTEFVQRSKAYQDAGKQKSLKTAAILRYKSSESYKINAKLREDETLTEKEQEFVNTLDEALEQLPTYEGTVYRQIIFDDFGEELFNQFLQEHSPGQIVSYPSFTSCSTTHDGYTVEGDYKVQLVVEGKSARNVDGYGNNMENEVVFPRDSTFIVKNIDTNGQFPIIYLQEVFENGYNTTEEHSNAVQHMQTPDTIHGNMQGVSKENTEGNHIRQVRPQSAASGGQRNTVRAGGEQETLLSAENEKQEVNTTAQPDEPAPTAGRVLDMSAISVRAQNFVKSIGKALGRKVEFVNMEKFLKEHDVNTEKLKIYPEGAIDGEGNIYIWYSAEKPVQFLFKHELTHFGERSKYYKTFVKTLRDSKVYLEWLKKATKTEGASREVMEAKLMDRHRDARKGLTKLDFDEARAEIIADFVGEKCFGESLKDLNKLVASVKDVKERNAVVRFLHSFFSNIKQRIQGISKLEREIGKIEDLFARMLADADNTKTSDTKDGGLKYSVGNDSIVPNMSEANRAKILRTKQVNLVNVENSDLNNEFDFADLENNIKSKVEKSLLKKFQELGLLKKYKSVAISDVEFDFTGKGVRKSLNSQETAYGGSKADFTKAVIHLQELLDNSVLIETHTDKGKGTDREQRGLKQVYVLLSAMREANTVIPVQFEVKQYIDENNRLYLAVALTKIETGVVGNTASDKQMATSLIPISNISISELFKKINPKDGKFLKYIPDEFLNSLQIDAKKQALAEDETKYGLKFSVATENNTETDTEDTDFTAEFKGLMQSFQNGEISQEEYMRRVSELYQQSIDENGQIKQGEKYTELQYNNFGWVRANDVLTAAEYNTLLSRYADYKHNKDRYPTTRFGEAVIHSTECPDVIMYVKGTIKSPQITKIIRIDYFDTSEIKEEIFSNERRHLLQPYKSIENFYGQEIFSVCKARDYASFRDYQAEQEGRGSQGSNTAGRAEQDRRGSIAEGEEANSGNGGVNSLKFSVATAENTDTSTDFPTQQKELFEKLQSGEITQQEYMDGINSLWERAREEYGTIPDGEMVTPENKPFPTPRSVKDGTKVRQHVRTILESGRATEGQEGILTEAILSGKMSYTPTSDEKRIKSAESKIQKLGYQKALADWRERNAKMLTSDKNNIATGEALLVLAFEHKSEADIVNLTAELAELGTRTAQNLQAMKLLKRMGGIAQLVYVERCVTKINEGLEKRFKRREEKRGIPVPVVKLDETLARQLAESKTEAEYEITYEAIMRDLAAQVPPTFLDKFNAWRYMAMLMNVTTHVRNFLGNAIFLPAVRIKNVLGLDNIKQATAFPRDRDRIRP